MTEIDSLEVRISSSTGDAIKSIDNLKNSLSELKSSLSSVVDVVGKDTFSNMVKNATKADQAYTKLAKTVKKADLSKITAPDLSGKRMPELQSYLDRYKRSLESFQNKAQKEMALKGGISDGLAADIKIAEVNIEAATKRIREMNAEWQRLQENAAKARAEQARAAEEAARAEAEANARNASRSSGVGDPRIRAFQAPKASDIKDIEEAKKRIEEYKGIIEDLQKRKDTHQGMLDSATIIGEPALIAKATSELQEVSKALDTILAKKKALEGKFSLGTEEDTPALFERIKAAMSGMSGTATKVKSSINGISGTFKNISKHVSSAVAHMRNFVRGLRDVVGANKKSNKSFKQTLNTILKYGFGIRSLYFLFRRLRKGIKEGFTNLAGYSSAVQTASYQIQAAMLTIKNAFAAGFSPIATIIAPYIQQLLNLIASALNAIGRFLSVLTGKGFAVQAIKVSAGSMADLADNTGSAASAAKKLDKALSVLPFDELNQLNGDKNSGGSGGGGGGGGASALSPDQMFETVELNGNEFIQQWAESMRRAFLNKDWEGLGTAIATGLNKGIDKVYAVFDWDKNKSRVEPYITAFTRTVNSLNTAINWDTIGKAIGGGINTVTGIITGLANGVNFKDIGASIGTMFNNAVTTIDWGALGQTITTKFRIAIQTFAGFVSTVNWPEVGIAIGDLLRGAVENLNFPALGAAIATFINGAVDAGLSLLQTGSVGDMFRSLNTAFNNFFEGVNWENVGRVIGESLASVDWAKWLVDAVKAMFKAITGILKGLFESDGAGVIGGALAASFGVKSLKGLFGLGGAAKGAGGLGSALLGLLGVGGSLFVGGTLGAAVLLSQLGDYDIERDFDFSKYGLSEKDLKLLERIGYKRRTLASILERGVGGSAASFKRMAEKSGGTWANKLFDIIEKTGDRIIKSQTIPRAAQVVFDEVNRKAGRAGSTAALGFFNGANSGVVGNNSGWSAFRNNLVSKFNISSNTATAGANAADNFRGGATNKLTGSSSAWSSFTNNLLAKFNIASGAKSRGNEAASSFYSGVNGYKGSSSFADTMLKALWSANVQQSIKKYGADAAKLYGEQWKKLKFSMTIPQPVRGDVGKTKQWAIMTEYWNAKGGIFDRATIIGYGVGEAGKEAILPLENRQTMDMLATSIMGGQNMAAFADNIVMGVTQALMNSSAQQTVNVNATLYTEDNEVLARAVNRGNRAISYREQAYSSAGV